MKSFMRKDWYYYQGRYEKAGNESEGMLLQTLTPLAELGVPAALAIMPPLPPLSVPIQPLFLTLRPRTSPPYRGQLENPVFSFRGTGTWSGIAI